MYNYLKRTPLMLALLGTSLCSFNATAAPANEFEILDFRFGMEDPSFNSWGTFGGGTPIDPSQYGTLVEGTYQGSTTTNELINFTFFGGEVHVYTLDANEGTATSPAGSLPGGPAPTIDLIGLTADMSSWFAQWNGTEFNQGNNTNFSVCSASTNAALLSSVAKVTDNLDRTYTISWNSCISEPPGGAFTTKVGFWQLDVDCLTCPETDLGQSDILTASQSAGPVTKTATIGGGDVVITSSFGATPGGYTFNWLASDPAVVDTDADSGTFTFDPSGLTEGNYIFTVVYKDNNPFPANNAIKGSGEIVIRLVSSATGDVNDSNGNRIENKDDAGLLPNQLQAVLGSDNSSYALETSSGSLRVGKTAFCAGKAARISKSDLDANASEACETAINTSDDLIKAVGIGGYYDFEITGISQGETVDVVIPLTEAIPSSAVYRKYTPDSGWGNFKVTDNDKLASAKSVSTGVCPPPTSDAYTANLTAGDDCVRLSITDGGVNDGDESANGLIKDPGAVAEIKSGTEATLSSGCSISGQPASLKNHSEWLLLFALITWLGLKSRKSKL